MIGVVDKFNMVDMGGIDIVESQGVAVDGLFSRLLTAIQNCRYQILYNWKFAQIEISPTYAELLFDGERISINGAVTVTEDDVVHIYALAATEPLLVIQNGTYNPPANVDGYAPVIVNVPRGYTLEYLDYYEFTGAGELLILPALLTDSVQTETDFMITGSAQNQVVSGTWDITRGGSPTYTRIFYTNSTLYVGNGTTYGQVSRAGQWENTRHVVKTNLNGQVWIDEESIGRYVGGYITQAIPPAVGSSYSTSAISPFVGRIYSYMVKRVSSGEVLCDLKPVKLTIPVLGTDMTGFYDAVTGNIYTLYYKRVR